MNEIDYQRAKQVAMSCVRSWLPDGRQEGSEWNAINPTRPDEKLGAFKINLVSGKWMDGSDGAKGNDCISLYVYLNSDRLGFIAAQKKYKNHFGGMMSEAAQEILLKHDPSYFPDDARYEPKESTGDFWAGYSQIINGIDHPPAIDLKWYEDKFGKSEAQWKFIKKGKVVSIVVRFRDDLGKKNDRPFTLWTNGNETKWRAKALPENIIYNIDQLEEFPNRRVLLTEGQKNGEILKEFLGDDFISVAWYGGANATSKTDWTPLAGREVYFSFDADVAGRNALIALREISKEIPFKLIPVYPPADVAKKWDLADAVQKDGWTKKQVLDHILNNEEPEEEKFLDDIGAYNFKILGYQGTDVVFYSHESHKIFKHSASSLTKGILMALMDRKQYAALYKKDEGGIAWDTAINDILRRAAATREFDPRTIRTSGAWMDQKRIVLHCGEHLIVDDQVVELEKFESHFTYIKGRNIPYRDQEKMSTQEASRIFEVFEYLNFTEENMMTFFAGWLFLAPFCGILKWRSHMFMNGDTGTGKSFVMTEIVFNIVGTKYGVCGFGSSTAAGPRTALNNSSCPLMLDEMEGDDTKKGEKVQDHLSILREASSGTESKYMTLHGSQDGTGKQWNITTMAFLAGINPLLKHQADKNRFTTLTLKHPNQVPNGEERFKILEEKVEMLTPQWVEAFHARTSGMLQKVLDTVEIFSEQTGKILKNRRNGDQVGTLLAGAYMITHDEVPTAQEAVEFINKNNIEGMFANEEKKSGPDELMDAILSAKIELSDGEQRSKVSIGRAILYYFASMGFGAEFGLYEKYAFPGADAVLIGRELPSYGIKLTDYGKKPGIKIAVNHAGLSELLKKTSFSGSYDGIVDRCRGFIKKSTGASMFDATNKWYYSFDAVKMINVGVDDDEIPF